MSKLEMPVNSNERFLHAIAVRLEVLIDQLSGITEHLADKNGIAVEDGKVETETPVAPKKRKPAKKTSEK